MQTSFLESNLHYTLLSSHHSVYYLAANKRQNQMTLDIDMDMKMFE